MIFIVLLIGAILLITAWNDTHGQLGAALLQDVPRYLKWALAIVAILALGFIPGFRTPSRWLLGLVLLVIVVTNYKNILAGVQSFTGTSAAITGQGTQAPDPTTLGATGGQPAASLSGDAPPAPHNAPPAPPNPFDPATYVGMFTTSTQGFGGSA